MSEFTEVFDDPLNPGKYISAEEQKRRDDALINDSTAKKTKKKKKKKGQITVSSILHNADKDEPETDSDEEDQSEKLNSLLTFAKGKIAAEKRKEALEVGVFVAANEAEEQTISATQQLKIDARLKKKEDAILKERNRKKALVTQGIEAIVSTEDLLKEEFELNNTNTSIDNIDDYFLSNNNNNNSSNDVNNSAAQKQINQLKDDERITKFKEHFSKGQSYAQKQDFSKSLLHLKIAFKYLVNTTTSKYAAMCIGTAASVEFALGELRNAKKHCLQALNILQHLNIRDKKLEQIFTMTLNKTLDDLGEGTSSTTTIVIDDDKEDTKTTTGGANKKKKKGSSSKNNKKKNKKQGKQQQQATQPQSTSDLLKSLGL